VNAYAGWRTSHGFDLHWDDHDVFVLQVAGRKKWKVYGMSRAYPLARDVEPTDVPPSDVLWQGLLEDGDLLYIPRGWWHVATPLDEPTLHLTAGINNPTGADFLGWYVDRLRSWEVVRQDIPHLRGVDELRAFTQHLRTVFVEGWSEELLQEFLSDLDARSRPRPHFSLPWSAAEQTLPPDGFRVKWNSPRAVPLKVVDGEVTIQANGRRWRFAEAALPVLMALTDGREMSLEELLTVEGNVLDPETIRAFVGELASEGLLVTM
jgi:hypothetical protein